MSTVNTRSHDERRRIRARMAATGEGFNTARRALAAAPAAPEPEPEVVQAFVNAPELDWTRTWGHRLRFAKRGRKAFDARVLPPEPGSRRHPWRLRILEDGAAEPRVVDARTWRITPDPARLLGAGFGKGERKRDPYLPMPAGFATESMLREQHRKQPAPGQHSAGVWHGEWHDSPVYWIGDAVDLPPLKGKAAERWRANRTCAECGAASDRPWPVDSRTKERTCSGCKIARSRALWRERRAQETAAAAPWATAILADPAVAILAIAYEKDRDDSPVAHRRYTVEDLDGTVLFSGRFPDLHRIGTDEDQHERETVLDAAAVLDGRRLVAATDDNCYAFRRDLHGTARRCDREPQAVNVARSDQLEPHYRWWWDLSDSAGWTASAEKAEAFSWQMTPPWGGAGALTGAQIRTLLQDMAAGRLPETTETRTEEEQ